MRVPSLDKTLLLDGGMSTELRKGGYDIKPGGLWTASALIEYPDYVRAAHARFFRAGVDIALTCSYQATFAGFKEVGLSEQKWKEAIQRSVDLAKQAAAEKVAQDPLQKPLYVAGSVGPYGVTLHDASEYNGHYLKCTSEEAIIDYYRKQASALIDAGVDFLAFETIPAMKEAVLVAKALERLPVLPPAWISFSCKDALHTNYGELFADAVRAVQHEPGVFAVGVNCTAPQHIEGLLTSVGSVAAKPFVVYPNLFNDEKSKFWGCDAGKATDLVGAIEKWAALNAKIIGGCCEVDSSIIQQMSNKLQSLI